MRLSIKYRANTEAALGLRNVAVESEDMRALLVFEYRCVRIVSG